MENVQSFGREKRREELRGFAPYARFQFPQIDENNNRLVSFLGELFEEFAEWADPRNEQVVQPHYEAEGEGGIGFLWIDCQVVFTTKLFIYDGNNPLGWQGIIIRDHLDLGPEKVDDVFRIAAKFEEFLQYKKIPYTRYNMTFPGRQEVLVK